MAPRRKGRVIHRASEMTYKPCNNKDVLSKDEKTAPVYLLDFMRANKRECVSRGSDDMEVRK